MDEFASAVRIFHSRGAQEKGSNGLRGFEGSYTALNEDPNVMSHLRAKNGKPFW
jgi:hypothetical protein